ncbi:MAG: hypothetical protein QG673_549 [Pseudomonadota bacterium]|nr:hypothetical protein [Pseudomonadota bacterium]
MQLKPYQKLPLATMVHIYNTTALLVINAISCFAIIVQIYKHELPCPLCLLQRIGFLAIGIGYLLNIVYKSQAKHYVMSNIAAAITILIAGRQVLLHIAPHDVGYGLPFLGLHLYTWVLMLATFVILLNSLFIYVFNDNIFLEPSNSISSLTHINRVVIVSYIALICLNMCLNFMECGLTQCVSDPIHYIYHDSIFSH